LIDWIWQRCSRHQSRNALEPLSVISRAARPESVADARDVGGDAGLDLGPADAGVDVRAVGEHRALRS